MDLKEILVSGCELIVTIIMAVAVVYVTTRALIRTNTDFDEDKEILKNNTAVGILVMGLLFAAANMIHQAFAPLSDLVHLWLTSPLSESLADWWVVPASFGNLILAFFIVVATLSRSLRMYGRMARTKDTRPGIELEKGNVAVGLILAAVVLVVSLFAGEGVRVLSGSFMSFDLKNILVSLCEFLITLALAMGVIYMTLRALIKTNTDFDEDQEILKGNAAVGVLVAALLLASANIMHQAFKPIADIIHTWLTSPLVEATKQWKLVFYGLGNLVLAFVIVVATLSRALRMFGKLVRTKDSRPAIELEKGNLAMGILLSSVVLIVSLFVGQGVESLCKSLIPKPSVGRMMMMR